MSHIALRRFGQPRQAGSKYRLSLLGYKLYGLIWAEVRIADAEFGLSEWEYEVVQV